MNCGVCLSVCLSVMCVCVCVCACVRHVCVMSPMSYTCSVCNSIVDSIEANVEQGAHRVEEGNKQLVKAIKHQVNYSPQCCNNSLCCSLSEKEQKVVLLYLVYINNCCNCPCNNSFGCFKNC